jgi:hypothetical protein
MRTIFTVSGTIFILLVGITAVSALEQRFDRPRYKDQFSRLDACYTFGQECGKKAADEYCSIHGFPGARNFETEHARPTQTIADGKTCDGNFCASFKYIVCFIRDTKPGPGHGWPQGID